MVKKKNAVGVGIGIGIETDTNEEMEVVGSAIDDNGCMGKGRGIGLSATLSCIASACAVTCHRWMETDPSRSAELPVPCP